MDTDADRGVLARIPASARPDQTASVSAAVAAGVGPSLPQSAPSLGYSCVKCGCREMRLGTSRSVSGLLAKILNIQTRKFVTVTCTDCGFTDFYERRQSPLSNVLDIFIR